MQRIRRRDRYTALLLGLVACALLGLIFSSIWAADVRRQQAVVASNLLQRVNDVVDEVHLVVAKLNTFSKDPNSHPENPITHAEKTCTEEVLLAMRRVLFHAEYIKDIGFFIDKGLVCTTGVGQLDTPVYEPSPDFIDSQGYEYWHARELIFFDKKYAAIILRRGRFNAVVDPVELSRVETAPFHWQVVYAGTEVYHLAGQKGLYQQLNQSASTEQVLLKQCEQGFCAVVMADKTEMVYQYSMLIIVFACLSLSVGIFVFLLTFRYLRIRHSIKSRLRRGLAGGNFYCLYQPVVELSSGRTVGCEVLARFKDKYGELYPVEFIPVIRKLGLTWPFTDYILSRGLAEISRIQGASEGFKVNFNIFPADVINNAIAAIAEREDIADCLFQVVLEITEDEYLEARSAQKHLAALSEKGLIIAIDDFGTGYSNLHQLKKIHSHILKIDRSFVMDIEEGAIKSSLIKHIVDIAHETNMEVVAEGVENALQHQRLCAMGVEYGQGWAFGKPMTVAALQALIEESPQDSKANTSHNQRSSR